MRADRAERIAWRSIQRTRAAGDDMAQFDERAFWLAVRQALLMMVDAIEVRLAMPRTSDIRKALKAQTNCDMVVAE
jgi:hypothetical protein